MPYQIIALVYIIIAGSPVIDEPIRVPHQLVFNGLEACQTFMKGDEFGLQREALASFVQGNFAEVQRKAAADAGEPEPPLPGIAITASCEEDKRL